MPAASKINKVLQLWVPLAVLGIISSATTYATTQQSLRQSANDPQIQMAEDAAAALANGALPTDVIPANRVDPSKSLAVFMTVTDDKGMVRASSTTQGMQAALPPEGTFATAKKSGTNVFTWAPADGTRQATVIAYYGGNQPGYVLAARSLREVEAREAQATAYAGLSLVISVVGTFLLLLIMA